MSTIQKPSMPTDPADATPADPGPVAKSKFWANFTYGMGTVLELFPPGRPLDLDAEESLATDSENVSRDCYAAFQRLALEYEEVLPMPAKATEFLSPEVLERYKRVIPDFPERWLEKIEEEAMHRRQMEILTLEMHKRGQILGFAIGLVAIIAGSVTAIYGAEWAGLGIGGGGVIGLVSVFVIGRRNK